MSLSLGDMLADKYRIEAEIGRGAFGRVYRARDIALDRVVAIKELHKGQDDLGSTQFSDYARRFEREARVQARFNHPNIVHVYELLRLDDDRLYLVMECVDGESLRDYLARRGPLPVDEAVRIMLDLLAGLAVVHADERDIVHRDIKPSNIMLTKAGQAKLTDFGLAQVGDESMRSGAGQPHPGSPMYMSPEQETTSAYLYPASDIFSVGCVLFELLTGVPYKQAKRRKQGLTDLRSDVPPWLVEVMNPALVRDPGERLADADELAHLVQESRVQNDESIQQTIVRQKEDAERKLNEPPQSAPSHTKATSLLSFEPLPPITTDNAVGLVELTHIELDSVGPIALAAKGQILAAGSSLGIHLFDILNLTQTGFIATEKRVCDLALSPNGVTLASHQVGQNTLQLWRIADRKPLQVLETAHAVAYAMSFAPDGTILASGLDDKTIRLWRVNDGTLVRVLTGHSGWVISTAFAPDGTVLASGDLDGSIRLWRAASGAPLDILDRSDGSSKPIHSLAYAPSGNALASGGTDGMVRLWRSTDNSLLRVLQGHTRDVNSIAFSPDATVLASGALDFTVRIWRVMDGKSLTVLQGHRGSVGWVVFTSEGRLLVTAGNDGTIRFWAAQGKKL